MTPLAITMTKPLMRSDARISGSWNRTLSAAAYVKRSPMPDGVSVPALSA